MSSTRVLRTVLAVAATGAALLALGLHAVATPWQPGIVLAAFSHQLMWFAPVGAVAAVVARRPVVAAVAVLASGAVLAVQSPSLQVLAGWSGGRELTVLQANLKAGSAEPTALVAQVRTGRVGLLATEELTDAEQQRLLDAGLARALPYRFTAPLASGGGGLGIWSRYPLRAEHNRPGYRLGVLTVQVAAPGGRTTFVAAHLLPPYPYPSRTWRAEIASLRGLLAGLPPGPVVVAGDFNATVDHAQFRALLGHGYADAAQQAGAGYLPTYPTDRWTGPVIGIDHVLVRGRVVARSVRTLGLAGSDHRALLAQLIT